MGWNRNWHLITRIVQNLKESSCASLKRYAVELMQDEIAIENRGRDNFII